MAQKINKKVIHSAWPYAHGRPHLGNIVGAIFPADVMRRWYVQCGYQVLWLFGSDQYGTPILLKSKKLNKSPLKIAEKGYDELHSVLHNLNMKPTKLGKTTSASHAQFIHTTIKKMYNQGHIKKSKCEEQWCNICNMALSNRTLGGKCSKCLNLVGEDYCEFCNTYCSSDKLIDPYCKICGNKNVKKVERSGLKLELLPIMEKIVAPSNKRYMGPWMQKIRPLEISRNLDWGVKCPIVGGVVYVWFEALCGYRRMVSEYPDFTNLRPEYFIGKDNFFHHRVVLDSISTHMGWPQASKIWVRNYLMLTTGKISKKTGNIIYQTDLMMLSDNSDSVRLYLATVDPLKDQTQCSVQNYKNFHNGVYCKNIANLYNRYIGLIQGLKKIKYSQPKIPYEIFPGQPEWIEIMNNSELQKAANICISYSKYINRQITTKKLWDSKTEYFELELLVCHILKLASLINPICPKIAAKILQDHGLNSRNIRDCQVYINATTYKYKLIKHETL